MRLLLVGSDKVYAIENYYAKYLQEIGSEVFHFSAQSIFYDYYQKNFLNKILFKSGLSKIHSVINEQFVNAVNRFQPDVIWVFKGMEIFPKSLIWAKKKGIKLVSYNPDNPFIFAGKGSGNKYLTDSIPLYDLHFTYNLLIEKQLKAQYKAKTAYLPFGYDLSDELFEDCLRQPEVIKVCFLGNPDKDRAAFVNQLASKGIAIDLYGNKWERVVQHPGISIFPPVYGDEMMKVLRRYRVQLNMMRLHNEDSHNMRTFEVPGVAGIMLAPDTTEHNLFFKNGEEVFLFKDLQDCVNIINYLISLNKLDADIVRQKVRKASIERGYRYKDRAAFALDTILKL